MVGQESSKHGSIIHSNFLAFRFDLIHPKDFHQDMHLFNLEKASPHWFTLARKRS
jgi:hypothetical protein